MRDQRVLSGLIQRFVESGHGAPDLWEQLDRQLHVLAAPMPDDYFELGRRTPAAMASLTARLIGRCANVPLGREPFDGRTAFVAVVENDYTDRGILAHLIYGRTSVARELMWGDYERNLARTLGGRALDDLHRRIAPVLQATGQRIPGLPEYWRSREPTGPPRPQSDVARELQDYAGEPLEVVIPLALSRLSAPITRSALTHLVAPTVLDPAAIEDENSRRRDLALETTVRTAIRAAWSELDPADRSLILGLSGGEDWDSLLARDPRLDDLATLERALHHTSERFIGRVVDAVGDPGALGGTAASLMERVASLTLEMAPDLGGLHEG